MSRKYAILLLPFFAAACGDDESDIGAREQATLNVKSYINDQLADLRDAAVALQNQAPSTGWSDSSNATAVTQLRASWRQTRNAYERVEGAIAVLFEDLDFSTDARYEMFLEEGDDDALFDGEGVIGMHGIERILWADEHPAYVQEFEAGLDGYEAPAYPADDTAALAFKNELAEKLVADFTVMADGFKPLALESGDAYRGVLGSMAEQFEKVNLGATGEDESRYAQHTLGDMRANLAGGREIYDAFRDWLRGEAGGAAADDAIVARFDAIEAYYDALPGDALPAIPDNWNPDAPDGSTAYGALFIFLSTESDETQPNSLVARMKAGADILGIPVTD